MILIKIIIGVIYIIEIILFFKIYLYFLIVGDLVLILILESKWVGIFD